MVHSYNPVCFQERIFLVELLATVLQGSIEEAPMCVNYSVNQTKQIMPCQKWAWPAGFGFCCVIASNLGKTCRDWPCFGPCWPPSDIFHLLFTHADQDRDRLSAKCFFSLLPLREYKSRSSFTQSCVSLL